MFTEVNGQTAWRAIKSTGLVSQYAIAVMHSNLWPGAHAFAVDRYVFILGLILILNYHFFQKNQNSLFSHPELLSLKFLYFFLKH